MFKHSIFPTPQESQPPFLGAMETLACALFGILAIVINWSGKSHTLAQLLFLTAYFAGGIGPTANTMKALTTGKLNVDLLMIIVAIGAAIINDWAEGVILLFLFSLKNQVEVVLKCG